MWCCLKIAARDLISEFCISALLFAKFYESPLSTESSENKSNYLFTEAYVSIPRSQILVCVLNYQLSFIYDFFSKSE